MALWEDFFSRIVLRKKNSTVVVNCPQESIEQTLSIAGLIT